MRSADVNVSGLVATELQRDVLRPKRLGVRHLRPDIGQRDVRASSREQGRGRDAARGGADDGHAFASNAESHAASARLTVTSLITAVSASSD